MNWTYTNIQHGPRLDLGLTPNEYCVLDVYYQTQASPRYSVDGWSENSYQQISDFLGFSKGAIHKMVDRFVTSGLMEVNPANSKQKKTTEKWYLNAYERVQKVNDKKFAVQKVNDAVQKVNASRSKSERHIEEREYKEEVKERGARAQDSDLVNATEAPTPNSAPPPSPQDEFIRKATGPRVGLEVGELSDKDLPKFEQGSPECFDSILGRLTKDLAARGDWEQMTSRAGLKMTKAQFFKELKTWVTRNQNRKSFYERPVRSLRGGISSFASWLSNDISRQKYGKTKGDKRAAAPTLVSRSPIRKTFTKLSEIA